MAYELVGSSVHIWGAYVWFPIMFLSVKAQTRMPPRITSEVRYNDRTRFQPLPAHHPQYLSPNPSPLVPGTCPFSASFCFGFSFCFPVSSALCVDGSLPSMTTVLSSPINPASNRHSRKSSSASFRICLVCEACAYGGRTSPGTTGVSSSSCNNRNPCLARMACFSARSIVARKSTVYASLSFCLVCFHQYSITDNDVKVNETKDVPHSPTAPPPPNFPPRPSPAPAPTSPASHSAAP